LWQKRCFVWYKIIQQWKRYNEYVDFCCVETVIESHPMYFIKRLKDALWFEVNTSLDISFEVQILTKPCRNHSCASFVRSKFLFCSVLFYLFAQLCITNSNKKRKEEIKSITSKLTHFLLIFTCAHMWNHYIFNIS